MKRMIIVALALVSLLLLVACNNSSDDAITTNIAASSGDVSTETDTEPVIQAQKIVFAGDGESRYSVVRPDECSAEVSGAASNLRVALMERLGLGSMGIGTDFEKRDFDVSTRNPYEILVGQTNREETSEAQSHIKYNDFIVKVSGTRLVILGGCDEATVQGVNWVLDSLLSDGALALPEDFVYISRSEYQFDNISLLGTNLADFSIVAPYTYRTEASILSETIGKMCGSIVDIRGENDEAVEYEIIVASEKRGVNGSFDTTDDFSIKVDGTKICISGGSEYAVASACRHLLDLLTSGESRLDSAAVSFEYTLPDRQVYIDDPSKLPMHWSLYFTTPEWMLDFNEKYAAMQEPDGRMMSCFHRGEMIYYPENSIEGYISAINLGADMLEIDPRLTKDGVFVMMHDETLNRMTDWDLKHGKNGLPDSNYVCDWTYDELMQLNLRTKSGGSGSRVTPYKIPTLDEAIKVCSERAFIRLDVKGPATGGVFWDYERDIWPLVEKYKAYTTVIFTWHSSFRANGYSLVRKYKKIMETEIGRSSVSFIGATTSDQYSTTLGYIKAYKLDYCIRLTDCNFSTIGMEEYLKTAESYLAGVRGKARVYIDAHGASSKYETAECWDKLQAAGINVLLVNHGYEMSRYIAQNYQPTKY